MNKGKHIAIKCNHTSDFVDSGIYEINLPYNKGETSEESFIKEKVHITLDGRDITARPQSCDFIKFCLTGDTKDTLVIGIHTVDNFNKVLREMTKQNISNICLPQA